MINEFWSAEPDASTPLSAGRVNVGLGTRHGPWASRIQSATKLSELVETARVFLAVSKISELWIIDQRQTSMDEAYGYVWHIGKGMFEIGPALVHQTIHQLAYTDSQRWADISLLKEHCKDSRIRSEDRLTQRYSGLECLMAANSAHQGLLTPLIIWAYASSTDALACEEHTKVIFEIVQRKAALEDAATLPPPHSSLTSRERECIAMSSFGYSEKEIAKMFNISPFTVRVHIENIKKKLGARNKTHAVAMALSGHQIDPELRELQRLGETSVLSDSARQKENSGPDMVDFVLNHITNQIAFKKDQHLQHVSFKCRLDPDCVVQIDRLT